MAEEPLKKLRVDRKHRKIGNIAPELADRCYTCGTCAGGCPANRPGPRLGFPEGDPGNSFWHGAGSYRLQVAQGLHPVRPVPVSVPHGHSVDADLPGLPHRPGADKVPGPIHKGTMMNLERGNNLGIPKDDFLFLLADLGVEMENDEDQPCPGFYCRWTKRGPTSSSPSTLKSPSASPTT